MFFFGSGSNILPYLLYLGLIWGVFILNGILGTTLKNDTSRKTEVICGVKDVHTLNTTAAFQKHAGTGNIFKKEIIYHERYLNQKLDYLKWRFVLSKFSLIQNITQPFFLRGPPSYDRSMSVN